MSDTAVEWKRNEVRIPVTTEMLEDMSWRGPWAKDGAEHDRWRRAWHERPDQSMWAFMRITPPWERPDAAVLPTLVLFPRYDSLRDRLSDAAARVRTSTADRLQIAAERVGGQAWCEADEDSSW